MILILLHIMLKKQVLYIDLIIIEDMVILLEDY